jgi:photosystem II stability/assembly factor-like uncharacterized protein
MKPSVPFAWGVLLGVVLELSIAAALSAAPAEPGSTEGNELEKWFIGRLHSSPLGTALGSDQIEQFIKEVAATRPEGSSGPPGVLPVNGWQPMGPFGNFIYTGDPDNPTALWTGRILDLVDGSTVASASGGLWTRVFEPPAPPYWAPLTERLGTLVISSVAQHPNPDSTGVLVIGTGEWGIDRAGTGVWKTTDYGQTWRHLTLNPGGSEPSFVFRVRYSPDGSVLHAATESGYYRSTNWGAAWSRPAPLANKVVTDLAIGPTQPGPVYAPVEGQGLWLSTNGGANWGQVLDPLGVLPSSGNGRGAVAISPSNPRVVYVSFCNSSEDCQDLLGVYRTDGSGRPPWVDVSPPGSGMPKNNYMGCMGEYGNVIAVSPSDANAVLAGGVDLWRTPDGGNHWSNIEVSSYPKLHPDYHAISWPTATTIWVGHDGGLSHSQDAGFSWDTDRNTLPITQFFRTDNSATSASILGGATQDNGVVISDDGGSTWWNRKDCDGLAFTVDPTNSNRMWASLWPCNERYLSHDAGVCWVQVNNGIPAAFRTNIVTDRIPPVTVYTSSIKDLYYYSTALAEEDCNNPADMIVWHRLNPSPAPVEIDDISVSPRNPSVGALVYAWLVDGHQGQNLYVYDNGTWEQRDGDCAQNKCLPSLPIRVVVPHPTNRDVAYAVMYSLGTPGEKVFKTADRGLTWTNISGTGVDALPDIPFTDLLPHPMDDNILFVASEFGCFQTLDGGQSWERWSNGFPDGILISDLNAIDLRQSTGEYLAVAGTFGRGIWVREISGTEPVAVPVPANRDPPIGLIAPNPARASTTFRYYVPRSTAVKLDLYEVTGKLAKSAFNGIVDAGAHSAIVDVTDLAAGIYYCRLEVEGGSLARRLIVLR